MLERRCDRCADLETEPVEAIADIENEGKEEMNILVICENIAPQRGISTIRWTKISKYIKINNPESVTLDILTTKKNYDDKDSVVPLSGKDELLEKDLIYFNNYYDVPIKKGLKLAYGFRKKRVGDDGRFVSSIETVKKGPKTYVKRIMRKGFNTYYNFLAFHYTSAFIKDKAADYDAVISSYDPLWPHMTASKIKRINKNTVWLADFRDSCGLCRDDLPGIARWHKPFIRIVCRKADAATRVADFVDTSTPKSVKRVLISNGYDPEEYNEPQKPDRFTLVFTGTIYGRQRDFGIIFRALNELINEGSIEKEDVAVVYAGTNSAEAKVFAEENEGLDLLEDRGLVPRKEAKELQTSAAILIQASYSVKNDESLWTGKMFEYMLSGKPIVYIVNGDMPNSIPSRNIGKLGGVCYEEARHDETFADLKKYVLEKYVEWKNTGNVTIDREENYIEQFSHREIAKRVWELITRKK